MNLILFLLLSAFLVSLILTPVVRGIALRHGLTDHPDSLRKLHTDDTPRLGGISIVLAYLASSCLGGWFSYPVIASLPIDDPRAQLFFKLLPAVLLIFVVGLLDDLIRLNAWHKLAGQVAAAVLAYWAGVRVTGLAGFSAGGVMALVFTVCWLVACTNAFNLIDGLDGLAAGLGFAATATLAVTAYLHDQFGLVCLVAPLAGALLGFLRYNFYPASIFLGDCGSLSIGFLLGCCGAIWSQKTATVLAMSVPVMALAVPLADTALALVRRALRGQPIFSADADHIHHRLLRRGLSPRRAVLVLYLASAIGALFSVLQSWYQERYGLPILAVFITVVWAALFAVADPEFRIVRQLIGQVQLRRAIKAQLSITALEQALSGARTLDECWASIRDASKTAGFQGVAVCYGGQLFEDLNTVPSAGCFRVRFTHGERQYVELLCRSDSESHRFLTVPFAEAVYRQLAAWDAFRPQYRVAGGGV